MKTAELMTMLSTVLLLASLAAQGSAVPLHPYMFGEELAEREQGAIDDSTYYQSQRDTRAVQFVVSDYTTAVFRNRQSWRNSNCKSTFNCAPVSPQHCGEPNNELIFFSPNKSSIHSYGCELDFTIGIDTGGTAEGLELALYKKSEPNADEDLIYYTYIVYKPRDATSYSLVVGERHIKPSCSSWQVFDISSIKDNFPPGVHEITLLVAAFRGSTDINSNAQPEHMSCEESRSLFVMDSDADINQFISQPNPPVVSGSKTERSVVEDGPNNVDEAQKQNEENNNQTQEEIVELNKTEVGSGKGSKEVEQETIEEVLKYLPSLSVYVSGTQNLLLSKRSIAASSEEIFTEVINGKDDVDQASGSNECKRVNKKIFLSEYITGVLEPQIVDIGECHNSTDSSVECRPSKYKILEILRKVDDNLTIQTIDNLIIAECSPSMYIYNNSPHDQPISVT